VPLIHGLVSYAAHLSSGITASWDHYARGHTPASEREEDDGTTVTIRTPDGQERLTHYARDGALTVASYTSYTVPVSIVWQRQQVPIFLAVNGTRAESNFEKIQAAEIQTRLRPLSVVL